ncbi:MAG: hypothetical protein V2A55_01855 [Candidatus Jorgensenbacteria bacterium]
MKVLPAVALVAVLFFLGQFQFLSIAGVNPNLFLIALLFFAVKADKFRFLGILLAVSAVLTVLFDPLWLLRVWGVLLVVLVFYLLKSFMTGNRFYDFLIGIAVGTFLFYHVVNLFNFDLPYALIFMEIVYNLALGILLWVVYGRLFSRRA